MENVILFGIGELDFDMFEVIKEVVKRVIDEGYIYYIFNVGIFEFREVIVEYYKEFYNVDVDMNNIIVIVGVYEVIYFVFESILEQGDDVIIFDLVFVCYVEDVKIVEVGIICILFREENKFCIDFDEFFEVIIKRIRMIVMNYLNNLMGVIMKKDVVKVIVDIVQDYNIYIFSDEFYEYFFYEGVRYYLMIKYVLDNMIFVNSFLKIFVMMGWCFGFVIVFEQVICDMIKFYVYVIGNVMFFIQIVGIMVLCDKRSWEVVERMRQVYDERRKFVFKYFNDMLYIIFFRLKGVFYIWVKIDLEFDMISEDFVEWFFENVGVVVIFGIVFGRQGEGWIRISYVIEKEKFIEVMERMKEVFLKL